MECITFIRIGSIYTLILLLSIPWSVTQAQESGLRFEQLSGVDDVSFGKINAIVQDSNGYMWFSDQTNGMVLRYDGSVVNKFLYNPEDPNSISGYYPETLAFGRDGEVWIGFNEGGGLDRYDPETGSFKNYRNDPNDPESLISDNVAVVLVDKEGMVWTGTLQGLARMDPATGKFTQFRHDPDDPRSISNNIVRSIYEDREGTLWVGTGVPWEPQGGGGLNRFDKETQTFTRFLHDPDNPNNLLGNKVRAIYEDHQGVLWVGTDHNGLHRMNRDKGTFTRVAYWPTGTDGLQLAPVEWNMDHITFITEDQHGYLLIGVYDRGIIRFNPERDHAVLYGSDGVPAGDYMENTSWAAYVADNGMIWLATQENKLYKADPGFPLISETELPDELTHLAERDSAQLWLGTKENGLLLFDRSTGKTQRYHHSDLNLETLSDDRITTLYVDKQNTLWIGTVFGLNKLNNDGESFTRYTVFQSGNSPPVTPMVTQIYEDSASHFWIGTSNGLFRLDKASDSLVYQPLEDQQSDSFVLKIMENPTAELFALVDFNAGTRVFKFKSDTGHFEEVLSMQIPLVTDACIDQKNILWVTSSVGLWNSNESWDTITRFRLPQTGAYLGEWSFAILPDKADNLWLGSVPGIIKLNADRDKKTSFGSRNGVNTEGNSSDNPLLSEIIYGQDDNIIFVPSGNGFYSLDPTVFDNRPGTTRLWAEDLMVNNEAVYPSNGGPIEAPLIESGSVHLAYDQSSFGLTFSAIEYITNLKKKITYKLDGYEEFWRESLSGQPVNFVKVPPGNYRLRYKTPVHNSNEWVEKSLSIQIAKPWWKKRWAYAIYAFILLSGMFYFDKYQKQRILERERNLAKEKELEQARKIKKAYDALEVAHAELKSTQDQLIHSEKMASLGELTAGIAHEIQNPLNFVNNFSEVSRELIDEMTEEIQNKEYEEVEALADDLKQNLEKINHHGKRADGIVKGMLQHSRVGDGKKEPTDLNKLADEYLRLAYHGLRAKDKDFNAAMETDFDDAIGKVEVVPQDIGRVLLNLITNAFHAVSERKENEPEGYEPTVSLTTRKTKQGVEVSVRDNGGGIPESIRDKIFQPFFTTKPTGEGTGLGLSMSYDIVTKGHGGVLAVKTTPRKGSEFIVTLPV